MRYECQTFTKVNLSSQRMSVNPTGPAFLRFLFRLEIANMECTLNHDHSEHY